VTGCTAAERSAGQRGAHMLPPEGKRSQAAAHTSEHFPKEVPPSPAAEEDTQLGQKAQGLGRCSLLGADDDP
jgi:hypothetical protein